MISPIDRLLTSVNRTHLPGGSKIRAKIPTTSFYAIDGQKTDHVQTINIL